MSQPSSLLQTSALERKPNFFRYATNELSQDAFFCWLIGWSHQDYHSTNPLLHKASLNFLKEIIPTEFSRDFKVVSCIIKMQKKNMDFIIEINESIIIHFEDKIKSGTTNDQLSKYKGKIATLYGHLINPRIHHIYLKTDLVWRKEKELVINNGYKLIDIFAISNILGGTNKSDIYTDFSCRIQEKINGYQAFTRIVQNQWKADQWIGFVYDLSFSINYVDFGKHYVGDQFYFILSWFRFKQFNDSHVSFEIVNKKCAIKAHVYDGSTDKVAFLRYIHKLFALQFKNYKTKTYHRTGKSVLVIVFTQFIVLKNGLNDLIKTKEKLMDIKEVFDKTVKNESIFT